MQSSKSLEVIVAFAGQASGLLTNKQVQQVQNMTDKCLNCIQDYDKSSYIRLLTAFLRLFLLVPAQAVEAFMFRYYSLLREWLPQKYRMQDRLDALVNALLEVADKHFLPFYQQIKNSRSVEPNENVSMGNSKSGIALNFKSFLNLFRKAIDKEKDYRSSQCISPIKDAYSKLIQQLLAPSKTTGKLTDSFSLKLHIVGVFYSVIATRFEAQTANFIKQAAEDVILKDGKNESALLLLMRINERDASASSIIVQIMQQWIKKEQSKQESSSVLFNYEIDTILSTLILSIVCDPIEERSKPFFKTLLALALRSSSLLHIQFINSGLSSFSEFTSINLEKLIIDLHSRISFHESTKESIKHSPFSIISSLSKETAFLSSNLFQNNDNKQTQQSLQYKVRRNTILNAQTKAHIFSMIWKLSNNENLTNSGDNLCSQFKLLNGQQQIGTEEWKKFIKEMCLGFGLPFTYQDYCNSQAIYSDSQSTVSPILQLQQIMNNNIDISDSEFHKILSESIEQLSKSRFCLQDLVDLIGQIISKEEIAEETFKLPSQFYSLSLVLFDKINLKPAMPETKKEQLTFNNMRNQTHIKRLIILIGQIYTKEEALRRNGWFQPNLAECGNDKIAVAAVRKWLGVKIGRINEAMVYGWIIRRDFVLLWCMLLCNYKVKLICEQILRSGIPSSELTAFFPIEDVLVREFIEFLAGKERYRLRLALWELNLQERQYLLDCSLTELLLKC